MKSFLGALMLLSLIDVTSAFGEQTILFSRIPLEKAPQRVFFLNYPEDQSPIFMEASFVYINKTLSAAAIGDEIIRKGSARTCMIIEGAEGIQSSCSSIKLYSSMVNGNDSKDVIHSQEELLKQEARALRQKELDHEIELRKLKVSIGSKIHMDALVHLRNERIEAQERLLSLKQEKQTLERSIHELKGVKTSERAQLIERSLVNSLYNYQRQLLSKKK